MDVPVDMTTIAIETDRLLLRPWRESDLDDFYEYASVEGVGEMAGWRHHDSREHSLKRLRAFIDEKDVFAIVCKENDKVIGSLGIHRSWANDTPEYAHLKVKEIGYVLSKNYWGKGLATEAARAVIHYCFHELGLDALTCGHFTFNDRSRRVIEKCGFVFVREREYDAKALNRTFVTRDYILVKPD